MAGNRMVLKDETKINTVIISGTGLQVDQNYSIFLSDTTYNTIEAGFMVTVDGKTGIGTTSPDEAFEVEFSATETDAVDVEMGK